MTSLGSSLECTHYHCTKTSHCRNRPLLGPPSCRLGGAQLPPRVGGGPAPCHYHRCEETWVQLAGGGMRRGHGALPTLLLQQSGCELSAPPPGVPGLPGLNCHHLSYNLWDLMGQSILGSALKSRGITLPTEVCLVKATGFPVVMYGRESWTIKKAECQRIDAFQLWCWTKLLSPLDSKDCPNQSIPKEISPEYSLEGLMLRLKLQYFGHLLQKANSLEKTLMLGKTEGRRRG